VCISRPLSALPLRSFPRLAAAQTPQSSIRPDLSYLFAPALPIDLPHLPDLSVFPPFRKIFLEIVTICLHFVQQTLTFHRHNTEEVIIWQGY